MSVKTVLFVLVLMFAPLGLGVQSLIAASNEVSIAPEELTLNEGELRLISFHDPRPVRRFWDLLKRQRVEFTLNADVEDRLRFVGAKLKNKKKRVYKYSYIKLLPVLFVHAINDDEDLGDFSVVFTLSKVKGGKIDDEKNECAIEVIDDDSENPGQNVGPQIISTAVTAATEDQAYVYQVEVLDPDDENNGTDLTWSLMGAPTNMSISTTGEITWTPVEGELSSGQITVRVADGGEDGAQPAEQQFEITVTPINDAPQITSTAITNAVQNNAYTYQVEVSDPDDVNNGSDIQFELQNAPQGMSVSNLGLIQWTPISSGNFGPITLIVRDGGEDNANPAHQTFSIDVVGPQNTAPVAVNDSWTLNEGASISHNVLANDSDPDGDAVTATLVTPPQQHPSMQLAADGTFTYNHNGSETISDSFSYRINDGSLNSNIATVSLTINPVNDAPAISGVPASTVNAGETYVFVPNASDVDSDQLTFSIQNAPSWASFNAATGELSGTPSSTDVQIYEEIVISVSDGEESTALPTFTIEVKPIASPSVEFADAIISVNEGGAVARVHVELSHVWTEDVTVQLSTSSLNVAGKRSATPDKDYYEVQQSTLTIPAGKTRIEQILFIEQDEIDEPNEIFGLTLSNPQGAELGDQAQAQITIIDDDEYPVLEVSPLSFAESHSSAVIKLSLSAPTEQLVSLQYKTIDDSAEAGADYTATGDVTVTFGLGETEKTLSIALLADELVEGDETFHLTIFNPQFVSLSQNVYPIVIKDDDFDPAVIEFSTNVADGMITEGGAVSIELLAILKDRTLSDNSTEAQFAREDITLRVDFLPASVAEFGSDFVMNTQDLTIKAGQQRASATLHILNDNLYEGLETTTAKLQVISGDVILENDSIVISINDDESAPLVSINDVQVAESIIKNGVYVAGQAGLTVSLDKLSAFDTTVQYATSDGTALAGTDYVANSGQVIIPAGSRMAPIHVQLNNTDGDAEQDEIFYVNLSNPSHGAQLADAQSSVVILDYDGDSNKPVLSFDPNNPLLTTLTIEEPIKGFVDVPVFATIPTGLNPEMVLSRLSVDAGTNVVGGEDLSFLNHSFYIEQHHVDGIIPESENTAWLDTFSFEQFNIQDQPGAVYALDVLAHDYVVQVATIRVYQDDLDEAGATETLNLLLAQLEAVKPVSIFGANLLSGPAPQLRLEIVDNHIEKELALRVSAEKAEVEEPTGQYATFICTLIDSNTGNPVTAQAPVQINYTLTGDAVAGQDYFGTASGSVEIPVGAQSVNVKRAVKSDGEFELPEKIIINAHIQDGPSATSSVTIKDRIAPAFTLGTARTTYLEGEHVNVKIQLVDQFGEALNETNRYSFRLQLTGEGIDDNDTSFALDQLISIQFSNGIGYIPIELLNDAGLPGSPEQADGIEILTVSLFNGVDIERNTSFKVIEMPTLSLTHVNGHLNHVEGETISTQLVLDRPAMIPFVATVEIPYGNQAKLNFNGEVGLNTDAVIKASREKPADFTSPFQDEEIPYATVMHVYFEAGEQVQSLNIIGLMDEHPEGDESFTIQLYKAGPYTGIFQPYMVSVTDHALSGVVSEGSFDPEIGFSQKSSTTQEGLTSEIALTLNRPLNQSVSVEVDLTSQPGDTADAADFHPENIYTVFIPAGETQSFLPFTANNDDEQEATESVTLTIQSAVRNDFTNDVYNPIALSATHASHQVRILETAAIAFTDQQSSELTVDEGQTVSIQVEVIGDPNVPLTAAYEIIQAETGNLAESDFSIAEGQIEIPSQAEPASQRTVSISVTVADDAVGEPDEHFVLRLKESHGLKLGTYRDLRITVPRNDNPPTLSFKDVSSDVFEGEAISLRLELSEAVTENVSARLDVFQSYLAASFRDYIIESQIVTIPAGKTYADILIQTKDNQHTKGDAWIDIRIKEVSNAVFDAARKHRLIIRDNEVGNVEFWVRPAGTQASFQQAESHTFFSAVDLTFKVSDGHEAVDVYYLTNTDPHASFGEGRVVKENSNSLSVYFGSQQAIKWDGQPVLLEAEQSIVAMAIRSAGSNHNFIVTGQSNAGQYWIDNNGPTVEPPKGGERVSPYRWLVEQPNKDTVFNVKTEVGDGQAIPLGNEHILVTAPLDVGNESRIQLIAQDALGTSKIRETTVNWSPSVIGTDGDIIIAKGDSLLLQAGNEGEGRVHIFPGLNPTERGLVVQSAQPVPVTYDQAGSFRVFATDKHGADLGGFIVTVLETAFDDERIIAEVDFEREIEVPDVRITYQALEPDKLIVTNTNQQAPAYDGDIVAGTISIEPKEIDALYLLARTSSNGAIIGFKEVEEFTIDFTPWISDATLLQAKVHPGAIKVRPFVPGLTVIAENRVQTYTTVDENGVETEQVEFLDDLSWVIDSDYPLVQVGEENEFDTMGVALDYGLHGLRDDAEKLTQSFKVQFKDQDVSDIYNDKDPLFASLIFQLLDSSGKMTALPNQGPYPSKFEVGENDLYNLTYSVKVFTEPSIAWDQVVAGGLMEIPGEIDPIKIPADGFYVLNDISVNDRASFTILENSLMKKVEHDFQIIVRKGERVAVEFEFEHIDTIPENIYVFEWSEYDVKIEGDVYRVDGVDMDDQEEPYFDIDMYGWTGAEEYWLKQKGTWKEGEPVSKDPAAYLRAIPGIYPVTKTQNFSEVSTGRDVYEITPRYQYYYYQDGVRHDIYVNYGETYYLPEGVSEWFTEELEWPAEPMFEYGEEYEIGSSGYQESITYKLNIFGVVKYDSEPDKPWHNVWKVPKVVWLYPDPEKKPNVGELQTHLPPKEIATTIDRSSGILDVNLKYNELKSDGGSEAKTEEWEGESGDLHKELKLAITGVYAGNDSSENGVGTRYVDENALTPVRIESVPYGQSSVQYTKFGIEHFDIQYSGILDEDAKEEFSAEQTIFFGQFSDELGLHWLPTMTYSIADINASFEPNNQGGIGRGNMVLQIPVKSFRTPNMGPDLMLYYNSRSCMDYGRGYGWSTNYDMRLFTPFQFYGQQIEGIPTNFSLLDETGKLRGPDTFEAFYAKDPEVPDDDHELPSHQQAPVTWPDRASYLVMLGDGMKYFFDQTGYLVCLENLRGESIQIEYEEYNSHYKTITRIVDQYNRAVVLNDGSVLSYDESARKLTVHSDNDGDYIISHNHIGDITAIDRNGEQFGFGYEDSSTAEGIVNKVTVPGEGGPFDIEISGGTINDGRMIKNKQSAVYDPYTPNDEKQLYIMKDAYGARYYLTIKDIVLTYEDTQGEEQPGKLVIRRDPTTTSVQRMDNFGRVYMSKLYGGDYDGDGTDAHDNKSSNLYDMKTKTTYMYRNLAQTNAELISAFVPEKVAVTIAPRPGEETQAQYLVTAYTYFDDGNLAGLPKVITYPDKTQTKYTYKENGLLETVTDQRGYKTHFVEHDIYGNVKKTSIKTSESGVYEETFVYASELDQKIGRLTAQYNNLTGTAGETGVSEFHDVFIFLPKETYGPMSTTVYEYDQRGRVIRQDTTEKVSEQGGGN